MKFDLRTLIGFPALEPDWTFAPGGVLWRLMFAPGHIIGESRSQEEKRVRFFCVEETTGEALWTALPVEERWWVGIEAVQQDVVLLHGFTKPDMPEHRGLRAFDLKSGKPLWASEDAAYWFSQGERVYTVRTLFDKRTVAVFDLRTGKQLDDQPTDMESLAPLRQKGLVEQEDAGIFFPQMFNPSEVPSNLVDVVVRVTDRTTLAGSIESLLHRDRLIFDFHEQVKVPGGHELRGWLFVINVRRSKVIHAAVLADHARAAVPDSFFIRGDRLFYVQDRTTLTAIRLWKS
jgi:hypothetical protein